MRTKAAVLEEIGAPLRIRELQIDPPGPQEVSIRVVASGICHSDYSLAHGVLRAPVPVVLGHEAAGVVESVGSGVHDLKKGDHVIAALSPSCEECAMCEEGKPFLCAEMFRTMNECTMLDGTTRLRHNGTPVYQLCGVGSFSERAILPAGCAIKVDPDVPLDTACLIGCGVTTGAGAALNTAQVRPGSSVAVVGCGGVGLSILQGARIAGATTIIAVEPNAEKRRLAMSLAATHTIDPGSEDVISQVRKITGRGVHYAFEALGRIDTIEQAYALLRPTGLAVMVGMPSLGDSIKVSAAALFQQKTLTGSTYGSALPKRDIPRFVELYKRGELRLEPMITDRISLEQVNDAFAAMSRGQGARAVIVFDG